MTYHDEDGNPIAREIVAPSSEWQKVPSCEDIVELRMAVETLAKRVKDLEIKVFGKEQK